MSRPSFDQVDFGEEKVPDGHTLYAARHFGVSVEDVTPEMRARAKIARFAEVYGGGQAALHSVMTGRLQGPSLYDLARGHAQPELPNAQAPPDQFGRGVVEQMMRRQMMEFDYSEVEKRIRLLLAQSIEQQVR